MSDALTPPTEKHDRNAYDPRYTGALSYYLGTPHVSYWIIDPATRTFTEGRVHRSELLDSLPGLIGLGSTRELARPVDMENDNSTKVMALHWLVVAREPSPDAAEFWYRQDIHEPAVRYQGKALVIAHSRDRKRLVSQRLDQEHMEHLFHWTEPTPTPHHLEVERLLAPLREAGRKFGENIHEATEAVGGRWPGRLDIECDARCLISVLEILAEHIENGEGLTEHDHGMLPFFQWANMVLEEEGYLDYDEVASPVLKEWASVYSY